MSQKIFDSPALTFRSPSYPAAFADRVPRAVRLLQTVRPDIPFFCNRNLVAKQGQEVEVWVNSHGAVAAILDGEMLGLKPGEFEVTQWHEGGELDLDAIEVSAKKAMFLPSDLPDRRRTLIKTDIPALSAEVRRLRGQVGALQAQVEALRARLQNERSEN